MRRDAIRRAQVWEATDVPSMDLKAGPTGHGAFAPDQTVSCKYVDKVMSGNSPKFTCVIPPDDEVKVKFGRENGEVYAEVAATRLFWALGFPVDRMYPVRVRCEGCPAGKETTREDASGADPLRSGLDRAQVQRPGHRDQARRRVGLAGTRYGGGNRRRRAAGAARCAEAARGLRPAHRQQGGAAAAGVRRRKGRRQGATSEAASSTCAHPIMMVNDLGQTFGRSNLFNRDQIGSVNLENWAGVARLEGRQAAASAICRRRRPARSTTRRSARRGGSFCPIC